MYVAISSYSLEKSLNELLLLGGTTRSFVSDWIYRSGCNVLKIFRAEVYLEVEAFEISLFLNVEPLFR
jgi:hypothetical protein